MTDRTCIYVATHKKLNISLPPIYSFCQVNAAQTGRWEGYLHDDDPEDNISAKNGMYSELTALYALWKRDDLAIKGLAHYRRFFSNVENPSLLDYCMYSYDGKRIGKHVLTEEQIRKYLESCDVILQMPDNPFYVNGYEDLHRWVFDGDIEILDRVMEEYYPEYLDIYRAVMNRTGISYLNMMVAGAELVDEYCTWLFEVLGRVEAGCDLSGYDVQHKRIYGYLSEVLLDVWVMQKNLRVRYLSVVSLLEMHSVRDRVKNAVRRLIPRDILKDRMLARTDMEARFARVEGAKSETGNTERKSADRLTLDDLYFGFRSVEDVLAYYGRFREVRTFRERFALPGMGTPGDNACCMDAVTVVYDGYDLYSYPQSNRFVIVNLFPKNPEGIADIIALVREKYGTRYTVNIRVLTADPATKEAVMRAGHFYVYDLSWTQGE